MGEKELFNETLKYFTDNYNLEIEHPYNDGYIVIKKDGKELGDFNSDGYNLLYNLKRLIEVLEYELS